jgi:hypothetical protein
MRDGHCGCVDENDSPIRDFASPIELVDRRCCHGCDSGVILIESRGNGASNQKGPFWGPHVGVLPVRVWSHMLLTQFLLLLSLFLNSKGDRSSVRCAPCVTPHLTLVALLAVTMGDPTKVPPRVFATDGRAPGGPGAGGVGVGDTKRWA